MFSHDRTRQIYVWPAGLTRREIFTRKAGPGAARLLFHTRNRGLYLLEVELRIAGIGDVDKFTTGPMKMRTRICLRIFQVFAPITFKHAFAASGGSHFEATSARP